MWVRHNHEDELMQKYLTALGALFITVGTLSVLIVLIAMAAMAGDGHLSGGLREVAEAVTSDVRAVAAIIGLLAAAPMIIGGLGLLKRKSWSWGCRCLRADQAVRGGAGLRRG